jgi:deoxyribodipyrimidine photo-lyase
MAKAPPSVIHWYRRDLRIADNTALLAAAAHGLPVVPVYIASTWKRAHNWTGPNRQDFLCGSLSSLASNLETLNGRLIVRSGETVAELRKLAIECGAVAIHFNRDPDPFGKATEKRLAAACAGLGIECHGHDDHCLHGPCEALTQSGHPYRVYTPYSRNWLSLRKPPPAGKPGALRTPQAIKSDPLPTLAHWRLSAVTATIAGPGERAARQRLKSALASRVADYAAKRDFPALSNTSRLSQDLRFGLISIRKVYAETLRAMAAAPPSRRGGFEIFIRELAWREFYFAILHHFPNVLDEEFNPDWRGLPWDAPGENLDAWREGRTGFPIVDAGMRELSATGFMHNRVRMIVAMFLTKDLHHDWKLGESHFLQHLVDGEIASNNGGWQWSAGTGADAAPYFRIQNPWSQTARYDPEGIYIKRWVPELAHTPPRQLIQPPADRRPIAPGYPLPCVDHDAERKRTLAIFKKHRAAGAQPGP